MLLYNAPDPAPNPRRVRLFLAEKGIELPMQDLSIPGGEHKSPEFKAKNPLGQVPALELDDGTVISESVSICRYLEALHPEPPLFGTGAEQIALVDMWIRRVENVLMTPVGMVWVHTHQFTQSLPNRFPDYGESNRERVDAAFHWFDRRLGEAQFVAGDDFSMADIVLLTTVDFADWIGLPMPGDVDHLRYWHERVSARPSATGD